MRIDARRKLVYRLFSIAMAVLSAGVGVLLLTEVVRFTMPSVQAQDPTTAEPQSSSAVTNFPNCRFGVGGNVNGYDVASLNAGWHLNFGSQLTPPHPNSAEYVQVVRLAPVVGGYVFAPTTSTLYLIMNQNPGSTWLIGNEPDSPWQDKLVPETYARAYHHLYYLIKQHDPSAQVGVAGIVQPTPLRFEYLDRVLNAYQQYYGERLPTDLWNIHSYILSEEKGVPGADIPVGLTATTGIVYKRYQMLSLSIFRQRLIDFRSWMRDRGYRDWPLYITEYGELYPYPPYITGDPYDDEAGGFITEDRVAAFMTGTFDLLGGLADPSLGYPADAYRLIQRWLWYSVSDPIYGGLLFDPNTYQRRPLGDVFYTYTHAILPSVDLLAVRVEAIPAAISDTGQLQTVTLKATISNIGNISITQPITVAFYAGQPPSGTLIGSMQVITSSLNGCAATASVSVTWPDLGAGAHPMYAQVDPAGAINETSESNNVAIGAALVATHRIYLPVVSK